MVDHLFGSRMRSYIVDNWQDIRSLPKKLANDREALWVIGLTLLPWCILFVQKFDINGLGQLGGFIGFMAFYWLVSHRRAIEPVAVRKPRLELTAVLILIALWILYRIGEYWHWFAIPPIEINACSSAGDAIVLKMVEMVVVPLVLLLIMKYSFHELGIFWSKPAWLMALLPILALIAFGLSHHAPVQFAVSSACYFFGAGLPEEFLFRVFLLTRLEAIIRRPVWALWVASFIFGLSHIPIDLHGSLAHWQDALLTAFTFQMSAGVAFGYAYLRTRNLLPLSLIHTFLDSAL
jgi:membrane protease YdiL (CAAX protease family)